MKVATVARQVGYLISYKSILENLRNQVKILQDKRKRVQENLTWDSEVFHTQTSWLGRVDEIVAQVNAFSNYYEGKGACTNFLWRYRVGREARKFILKISQLHEEGKFDQFVKLARPRSRIATINDIMAALKDPLIPIVGAWGLGGGGTTSVAKHIGEQAKEQDLFDSVVMITVTKKPNVEQVQEDIAAPLGLQFQGEMNVERRKRLRRRIKKEKRILVIVDDIWGELNPRDFDLEEIGVPLGDEHKGCKLLLTSGNLDFMKKMRGTPKVFQLEELLEDEALSLFQMVGGVAQDSEACSIVTEIVKSCAGSAPLIFVVAKALKNKGLDALQEAIMQLKDNVPPIKLCYDSLDSEELKSLFLLLTIRGKRAINRDNIYIDMWAGLFKNADTLEAVRNRRDSLISELYARGLVVEDKSEWVKVDDLIWENIYSIAQRELKVTMISEKWPPEDWMRSSRFCSMTVVNGLHIPEKLQCPELQEIVLSTDSSSVQVPDYFFEETKLLKVLDVIGFDCSKLPVNITEVGELTNLRILGLHESRIQQLPREIGQFQKLLFLDLRDTYLQVIPANVLSNLTSLEEIYLRNSFCNWEVERSNKENNNASLKELSNLSHLAYIEDLYVPDLGAWPVDLFFDKLKSYTIFIGDRWGQTHDGDYGLKTLKLKLNRRFQSEDGIKKMLKNVDVLYLDELNGVQNVLSDLESDWFPHLQSLSIQHNDEIKCIVMNSSQHALDAFPNLESLSLDNLSNLEHIYHGPVTEISFFKIRVIKVHKCDGIIWLFSNLMIKGLPHLADIEVSECKLMEAIVVVEGVENPHLEFPELRSLNLQGLPTLITFYLVKEDPSDYDAPILFNDKVSFPNLETMMISDVIKMTEIWDTDHDVPNSFLKLKNVRITDCEKLQTVFPNSLSRNLHNLKTLTVRNCISISSIFTATSKDSFETRQKMIFQLIELNLVQLPNLMFVFRQWLAFLPKLLAGIMNSTCAIEFAEMDRVHLEDLPNLSFFVSGNVEWPSLENVVVKHCPRIRKCGLGHIEKSQLKSAMLDNQFQEDIDNKVAYLFELGDQISTIVEYTIDGNKELLKAIENLRPSHFTNLRRCRISHVSEEGLLNAFLLILINRSNVLEYLIIEQCDDLQSVFRDTLAIRKFPMSKVVLLDLPNLWTFHGKLYEAEFSALKSLMIEDCPQLIEFTDGFATVHEDSITDGKSFSQLNELKLVNCHRISCVISSKTLKEFGNLEKLTVSHCKSLKTVFKIQGEIPHSTEPCLLLQKLSELTLIDLPNLIHIINNESISLYENLLFLRVKQCNSLSCLAMPLMLNAMEISDCQALEKIIIMDKGEEKGGKSFSELKHVSLQNLTRLSVFFPPISEFPSLETLRIENCPLLKTFVEESHEPAPSSYFFPNSLSLDKLKVLQVINQVNVEKLWHYNCPFKSFCNLENLTLSNNNNLLEVISSSMIIRYNNLKFLKVDECELLKEVFNLEDDKPNQNFPEMLPQLKELALSNLSSLTRIWNKEPQVPFFPNLVSLHIVHCGNLKISHSATRNLGQLKLLKLYDCEKIDEVISGNENENVFITFPKLECLILKDLPNLASFCQQSGTFKFPKLQTVRVSNIPRMETFFGGNLNTPLLRTVYITFAKKCWHGNLNDTISYLYEMQVVTLFGLLSCDLLDLVIELQCVAQQSPPRRTRVTNEGQPNPIVTALAEMKATRQVDQEASRLTDQGQIATWTFFTELFLGKYFLYDARECKQGEFEGLVQGFITVDEYFAKFKELAKFANCRIEMPTPEFLASKFRRGLNEEIVKRIAGAASRDFGTLVQQCCDIEDVCVTNK
ncbi:uncharacterized protein LOC133304885 [Gastrolobium bilobum]|uniref:uncharacterized protein LOC133304885 n=1 Tax=Gastrolobium bilobum TaxID=150636 RepID=UPI002AB1BA09|nr:uncharacterized protein LOC133304885 [Gastrolobium bilobum]